MAYSKFKEDHSFIKRKGEADRIRQKYTDRVPIICDRAPRSDIKKIDKTKYLVPADLTVGQFVFVIRKRIELSHEQALFLFVQDELAPTSALVSQVYEQHKDEDGFLYITYAGESTFGAGLADLPVEIWDDIVGRLEPASKISLALTCKTLLATVNSSQSIKDQFRCFKTSSNNRSCYDNIPPIPRWQVLTTPRWVLLEHLEDSRWKCCSTCLKLHPVGYFSGYQIAEPPKERFCRLGIYNGLVHLCRCSTFSFLDKTDLTAKLEASGGQWTEAQTWHKCEKSGPACTPNGFDIHVQLRPQLGPKRHLRIETTYRVAIQTFHESRLYFERLLNSQFACPHCTLISFINLTHPGPDVKRNMTHNFGDIIDSMGPKSLRLGAKKLMTCTKCDTYIISYGALGPDAAGTRFYFRTVRDLGGALDRPDEAWYRQTSTSLEGLEASARSERNFQNVYDLSELV